MRKSNVRNLTYGASISAIYVVLIIFARATGQLYIDSPIFFLLPVPVALYAFRYGIKYGMMVFSVTSLATVLIDPTMGLILVSTATLSGVIYGYLEIKLNKPIFKGLLLFFVFIIVDLLVTYLGGKIFGYDLIKDTKTFADQTFSTLIPIFVNYSINKEVFINLMVGLIPLVIILSDLIRTVFTMILFDVLALRLKFISLSTNIKKLYLKLHPVHSIVYIILFICSYFLLVQIFIDTSILLMIFLNLVMVLLFVYGLLIILQTINFLCFKFKISEKSNRLVFTLLALIIFPVTILSGLFINIYFYKV